MSTSPKATDKGKHLATHITLTMATKDEVQEAEKSKIMQLEEIDVTDLTNNDRFVYAEKAAPAFSLDLKLNIRLPLPNDCFDSSAMICKNSSISLRNWRKDSKSEPLFFRSNTDCFDVIVRNFEPSASGSEPPVPRLNIHGLYPCCTTDPSTIHMAEVRRIHIDDAKNPANMEYVLAESQMRYTLFKVKIESKDEKLCDVDCSPCDLRRPNEYGHAKYNIVSLINE